MVKSFLATFAIAVALVGWSSSSRAQNAHEAEIIGFHQLCDKGDKRACVRFGMMIEHDRDMHGQWRKTHPEFFWWEH